MGITVSHTAFSPLSLVSTIIGFISFTLTLATLLKVFWTNLNTFGAAPQEIQDYLSSLKQGLLEERRHLRRARRRLKSVQRDQSHGPGARSGSDDPDHSSRKRRSTGSRGRLRGTKKPPSHFDRNIQSMQSSAEDEALRVMRTTVKDLIKSFRDLERPFLKPEFVAQDAAHWSMNASGYPPEKAAYAAQYYPHSDDDSPSARHMQATNRLGHEYRNCGIKQRWLWVRLKAAVVNLNVILGRVETRRTAHEVGEVLSVVCNIGRDVEDLRASLEGVEGRLNRVVGVRRVE